MVFSKLEEFVSAAVTRLSSPKASILSYKSPGLPPIPSSLRNYTYSTSEKKTNLRISSSLQDLSIYRKPDIEENDLSTNGVERTSSHGFPPNLLQKGDGLSSLSSFSKARPPPVILSKWKKWVRVIFFLLLCLFFLASLSLALRFLYSKGPSKFYVVLDCGSTGTRVYIYEASVNYEKDDNLPISLKSLPEGFKKKPGSENGRAYNRMETEPGFDKLVHNISGLRKAIKPLIHWAEKQIPKKSHKTTTLFLYATAGVRRLPSSDSEWLLNNAWSILKSSPFLCKKEFIKIITGMEEAYYGWIALNYHTGVLGSIPRKETYGALDLGGSSLQVTFEGKREETNLKLSLGSVNHHLNAYSLSGFGLNDAFDKSVAYLLKNHPRITEKVEIKHPCLQSGYKELYVCSSCASVGKKPLEPKKTGVFVRLIGAPKWDECSKLAKVTVNLSEWSSNHKPGIDCEVHPCALEENLPHPVGQFYGMSGFYVVYRFFNLTSDASLDDVLRKGREFCDKTWDVAKKSVVPQPFIEQYCFRAPYIVLLLREGLHISDGNVIIGSGSITWTLGVALYGAGKAFPFGGKYRSYDVLRVRINPVILFVIMFASLFVLVFAFTCAGNWWMPKLFRRPCLPIFFRGKNVTSASVLNLPAPFRFQRWSPMNTGDGRVKMPLSPTVSSTHERPFDTGLGDMQFTESSLYSSSTSVAHSYSSGSLGQMQFDNNALGSFWTPHGGQMRLQSRRSQSREDLNSSIAEAHLVKG
ncbi:hypothetical protein ACJIZ3_022365 [Penstemon smallii]|uniref:Apyrase 7 n=1 Tax=Penstemon smallii TaxID=265156 RepID=A0ABD3TL02_9LAMI